MNFININSYNNNNRYMKSSTGAIDVDKQKVGNSLTFSQMVEKELQSNSQFSPYHKSNSNNSNLNINNKINNTSKKEITDEDKDFINLIGQFLPEEILYLLVSKNKEANNDKGIKIAIKEADLDELD